jgi:glycosyltransferase involved in cell wall biosynthesis
MKKILIIHPALAPYMIDQFNMISQLANLEVVFLFRNPWYDKFDQNKLLSLLKFKYDFLLKGPHYKERVFRFKILSLIRKTNPDIIIGYEYSFTTQYLILLKHFGFIHQKIGSIIDDSLDICYHVQTNIRYLARQFSVNRLDYLIVQSNEVSKFYRNRFDLKDDRVIVSPILQEPERLRENRAEIEKAGIEYSNRYHFIGKKVLLFVGRFVPVKGVAKFIATIDSILKQQDNLVFVLIGEGVERENIETIVKDMHLEEKVLMPGRYEGSELYAWYLCASGLILPSTYEPFGAVVNESLIFGTKVFCSKHAGASVLIRTDTGMLFDPLDEKETFEKMDLFLNSIDVLCEIDLEKKPSLMFNHQQNFRDEWNKLSND